MQLGRSMDRYLAHQQMTGVLSANTVRHRRSALRRFEAHCGSKLDVDKVRRTAVENWLAKTGRAPSTKRYYLAVITAFSRWCLEHELVRRDFTLGVRRPRLPRRIPRALTSEQVQKLLIGPDARMLLCLVLALQEGLRVGEITRLETGDVDRARRTVTVRGKGGHERTLPISEETWACLCAYMGPNHWPGGAVIRSKHDGVSGLSPHTLSMQMSEHIHRAGVDASAHPLRHTAASEVLERCGDILAIRDMLGHASVSTSQIYVRSTNGSRLRDVMSGRRYLGNEG